MTKAHFQVTGYGQASGMHHLTVINNKQYHCYCKQCTPHDFKEIECSS